jgi:hypothetical protein
MRVFDVSQLLHDYGALEQMVMPHARSPDGSFDSSFDIFDLLIRSASRVVSRYTARGRSLRQAHRGPTGLGLQLYSSDPA